jgi:predicted nucleic acid-binding protein
MISIKEAVLDSSVIIKWFKEGENLADQSLLIKDTFLKGEMHVFLPDLVVYELGNILCVGTRLSSKEINKKLLEFWDFGFEIIPIEPLITSRAAEIAIKYKVTFYDASFVALGQETSSIFITADQALFQKLHHLKNVKFLGEI